MSVGGPTSVTWAPILHSPTVSDRATLECKTSPTMVTLRPSMRPYLSRMVYMSRSAWVGCSCVPSPALITLPRIHLVRVLGAPDDEWRMTIASAPMACRVRAVSFRLSPLATDDPDVEKLMTSADNRLAASSKEMRVLVEFS